MPDYRVHEHPILTVPARPDLQFTWQAMPMIAKEGETIASALFANGVRIFGHHHKDGAPQGLYCANGQCVSAWL
jgi:sarcosine oxidase subunit alpha